MRRRGRLTHSKMTWAVARKGTRRYVCQAFRISPPVEAQCGGDTARYPVPRLWTPPAQGCLRYLCLTNLTIQILTSYSDIGTCLLRLHQTPRSNLRSWHAEPSAICFGGHHSIRMAIVVKLSGDSGRRVSMPRYHALQGISRPLPT